MLHQKQKHYPTDLTDREWELILPLIPPEKPGGCPREMDIREVFNAIFYITKTGCQWRLLPKDFPSWNSVYNYFRSWKKTGHEKRFMIRSETKYGRRREKKLNPLLESSIPNR